MTVAAARFESYTPEHYVLLVLFAVGAVSVVLLGRSQRRPWSSSRRTRRVLAAALTLAAVPNQVYVLAPDRFSPGSSLPLELCDLAWMAAIWALWSGRPTPTALTYFWGLTLTVQGILTPALGHVLGEPQYFVFWGKHLLVVWSALFLTLGLGRGPSWRDYRTTVAVTAIWAVVVSVIDRWVGANYGYLVRKPGSASLLDAFGPWPVYLFVSLGVLVVGWALLTWPWEHPPRRRAARGSA